MSMKKHKSIYKVYFGHHRCATWYCRNILYSTCEILKTSYIEVHECFHESALEHELIVDQNVTSQTLSNLNKVDFKGLHVFRDPRDILVSTYYLIKSHPGWKNFKWMVDLRPKLETLSIDEGLSTLLRHPSFSWIMDVLIKWDFNDPRILEVRFETLIEKPTLVFEKLYRDWGWLNDGNNGKLSRESLQTIIDDFSFVKMSNSQAKSPRPHFHYRKGAHGDWKNHFGPTIEKVFNQQYSDLIVKMGYEL